MKPKKIEISFTDKKSNKKADLDFFLKLSPGERFLFALKSSSNGINKMG